jgi:hypothetical protein
MECKAAGRTLWADLVLYGQDYFIGGLWAKPLDANLIFRRPPSGDYAHDNRRVGLVSNRGSAPLLACDRDPYRRPDHRQLWQAGRKVRHDTGGRQLFLEVRRVRRELAGIPIYRAGDTTFRDHR